MSINTHGRFRTITLISTVVACAMALAAARPAQAESYLDGGSSLDKTDTTTAWAQDSSDVGTFGAGYTAGYTECNSGSSGCTNGTTQYVSAYGAINGELFGSGEFQVGELEATGSSQGATYDVYFGSALLYSLPATAFTAQAITFGHSEEVFTLQYDMVIVVIPITAKIDLEADQSLTISGSLSSSSSEDEISWTLTPTVSTTVVASVYAGVDDFNIGFEVSCDIINLSLPFTLMLDYLPQVPQVGYTISGTLTLTSLFGSIAAYAHAIFLDYTYTLFSWDGVTLASVTVFTDDAPTASNPVIDLSAGYQAVASYSYADPSGYSESGSTYEWEEARCSTCTGTSLGVNSTTLPGTDVWTLNNTFYLIFCVTPSNGHNPGAQACSQPTLIGPQVQLNSKAEYNGTSLLYFYENDSVPSNNCFNVPSSFSQLTNSVTFWTPTSTSADLVMYSGSNCSGSTLSSGVVAADSSWENTNLANNGFGNTIESFKVVNNDGVGADIQLSLVPEPGLWYAYLNYSFSSTGGLSESGSTYTLQQATDSSGDGATTVASGSITANTGVVSTNPNYDNITDGTWVNFCVTPADILTTGAQSCSGWTQTTTLVAWYAGESETEAWLPLSVANGSCQSATTVTKSYVGTPKSLALSAPANTTLTINMYTGSGCSGTEYTKVTGVGTTHNINLDSVGIGSNLASYQITW